MLTNVRTECVAALRAIDARPDLRARFILELDNLGAWDFIEVHDCVGDFRVYESMLAPINPFLLLIGFHDRNFAANVAMTIDVAQTFVCAGRCLGDGVDVTEDIKCAWCGRTEELQLPPYYHDLEDTREQDDYWWGAVDDAGYQDVRGDLVCGECALDDPQVIAEGRADLALAAWKDGDQ